MIPAITDPNGRYWDQPKREDILIDETHAIMSKDTFAKLCHYEISIPSGVYTGKMWRRRNTLVWFADHPTDAKLCSMHCREIIIV